MPGSNQQQGAVIGGASGAAVGAAVTKNRALGAVIGGAVGAAGGYVLGGKVNDKNDPEVQEASAKAQTQPATAEEAARATTADVNSDGFVTLDEVIAMEKAGISDEEMLNRLRVTSQVFDLTEEQSAYLLDQGVSTRVVTDMTEINRDVNPNLPGTQEQVIGSPSNNNIRR